MVVETCYFITLCYMQATLQCMSHPQVCGQYIHTGEKRPDQLTWIHVYHNHMLQRLKCTHLHYGKQKYLFYSSKNQYHHLFVFDTTKSTYLWYELLSELNTVPEWLMVSKYKGKIVYRYMAWYLTIPSNCNCLKNTLTWLYSKLYLFHCNK